MTLSEQEMLDATKPQPMMCIIPARRNSKRIKGKNKRLFIGRPLFDYALKAAIDSDLFQLIVVSSDDTDILAHTYSYFHTDIVQPHKRPKTLCGDDVPIRVVVRYCIQAYKALDNICLIQPTNPFITAGQIKEAWRVFKDKKPNYLIGMCNGKDIGFHIFNKISFLTEYDSNFYGTNWIPFEMNGVDIDTEEDFLMAQKLIEERDNATSR